jgi:hypothetical protein
LWQVNVTTKILEIVIQMCLVPQGSVLPSVVQHHLRVYLSVFAARMESYLWDRVRIQSGLAAVLHTVVS